MSQVPLGFEIAAQGLKIFGERQQGLADGAVTPPKAGLDALDARFQARKLRAVIGCASTRPDRRYGWRFAGIEKALIPLTYVIREVVMPYKSCDFQTMSDHITITLERANEVIDLEDFAAMFAGLGAQFDDFLKERHPDVHGHATMGIRKLCEGSIVAELAAVIVPEIITAMDSVLVMRDFITLIQDRFVALGEGRTLESVRKRDLQAVAHSVQAIARDSDAKATYEYLEYHSNGSPKKETRFSLKTTKARKIMESVEQQKAALDKTEGVDYERVLMVFAQADVGDAPLNRRSGEQVVIEEISDRRLALIYQSNMAEQRIKSETRDADSVFHKGFVVNVNVRTRYGKPVAYAISSVHSVIDLPEDDDDDFA